MVKRCPAPPTWGQDGTSVATTLGNSHDVPVATFLSTGHVPVTSQGATFLQPHGKGRAMLTDEETSWEKERKVPGLVAKRRRSPGGCSQSHGFPGSPTAGKCQHAEVQASLCGSLTSSKAGTEHLGAVPANSHGSQRVPPCLCLAPPICRLLALRSNEGHSFCPLPWPLPRGGNEGPGAGGRFPETTRVGEGGPGKLWRPSSCSRTSTTFTAWAAASGPRFS